MAVNKQQYEALIESGLEFNVAAILADPANASNPLSAAVSSTASTFTVSSLNSAVGTALTNSTGKRAFVIGTVAFSQTSAASIATVAYTTTVGGNALSNQIIASLPTATAAAASNVGVFALVDAGATFSIVLTNATSTAGGLTLVTL